MKIIYVHSYGVGGSGSSIYARNLARTLTQEGHEVLFIVQRYSGDEADVRELQRLGVRVVGAPSETLALTYNRVEFDGQPILTELSEPELKTKVKDLEEFLLAQCKAFGPARMVVNHFLIGAAAGGYVARELDIPCTVVSHGTDIEYSAAANPFLRRLALEGFRAATLRVALTEKARDRIVEVLGVDSSSLVIMPPGIDGKHFAEPDSGRRPKRVTLVGRVILDKGPHILIAALPRLLEQHPDLRICLVGDGPDRARLGELISELNDGNLAAVRKMLARLGSNPTRAAMVAPALSALCGKDGQSRVEALRGKIGNAVDFAGYLNPPDVGDLLNQSRVAVLPSMVAECFPLTLLEALASGCNIVASELGAPPDLLTHLEAIERGLSSQVVFNGEDIEDVVEKILKQLRDWTAEQSAKSSCYVRNNFSWQSTAKVLTQGRTTEACTKTYQKSSWLPRAPTHSWGAE